MNFIDAEQHRFGRMSIDRKRRNPYLSDNSNDDQSEKSHPSTPISGHNSDEQALIRRKIILANLSAEQLDRYEQFRQASLSKQTVKRIVQRALKVVPRNDTVIILSGIAKILAAELIGKALDIRGRTDEMRMVPLSPADIQKANEKLKRETKFDFFGQTEEDLDTTITNFTTEKND
ncbi:hypothetical protein ACOME3_009461 [Neoechinorhynchus agilis]